MGVLLALSTIFIWGRLVNIDCDLKDISEELKKMNERRNDGRQIFIQGKETCQAMETARDIDLIEDRPDWCPLRELPEKMEVCGKYPQPGKPVPSYRFGWNACLDEILKTDGMRKE